ncbi:SDR family oxidoreductase [Pengzhenrongella phosphoraccumulans]|jgi:NAD(P)-dependent dehydrogenase (short-subunit alcohol dehydrogenase family)|uniref:SDR family oxidoreductase n=1 Tax=Pengzhenrongella phosphoraccumulans TaxID=3114394 RepID=UPI00388E2ED9
MRTYVVTGSASGIGKTTVELLTSRGHRVIGVDLREADITADLTTAVGRAALVDDVADRGDGRIDGVVACAGLAAPIPATVGVNFFGMVSTLEGLRPLLAKAPAPRAVGISSMASLMPSDDALVAAMAGNDEPGALARAAILAESPETGGLIYGSTKKAFSQWIRRTAPSPAWAGAGIPLNAVAPGIVLTPMTAPMLETEEAREQMRGVVPMPLNGFEDPIVIAYLLAWLVSEENTHLCGQVIFIDGGSDVVIRGDSTW